MTAPEELSLEWTPWLTLVCARKSCSARATRRWMPGQPPPKYCSARCSQRESNRKNKVSQNARKRAGEEIGQVVRITITHCARPGCDRTGDRDWHTASEDRPLYCSTWCARRHSQEQNRERAQERDLAACEHPEKRAYKPSEQGVRRCAGDAVKFAKYVYACKCLRFHLTSEQEQGAPLACVDHKRPVADRRDAWYDYLLPIAQKLREQRQVRSARARS